MHIVENWRKKNSLESLEKLRQAEKEAAGDPKVTPAAFLSAVLS
jgi:hypothetical protein